MKFESRLKQVQARLSADQAVLFSHSSDITYLGGEPSLVPTEREALMILTAKHRYLIQSRFSPVPNKALNFRILNPCYAEKLTTHLETVRKNETVDELLFDARSLFADEYQTLQKVPQLKLRAWTENLLSQQRMIKDEAEIETVKKSSQVAAAGEAWLREHLVPGVSELEIKHRLDGYLYSLGSETPSFPTIVAFGPHSALPHHQPTDTTLTPDTPVLVDWGCTIAGYHSDMTRMFTLSDHPSELFTQLETTVHQAYQAVIALLQDPTRFSTLVASDLDHAARQVINQAGFGDLFLHTTGHGVGLDIHEEPSVGASSSTLIKPGMIITVEPGIYLEGKLGFRYENTILVTDHGCEVLTTTKGL